MIRRKILCLMLVLSGGCLSGCGTRVVYARATQSVRLAETVKARVWVKGADSKWVRGDNRVELQDGGYYVPDGGEAVNAAK